MPLVVADGKTIFFAHVPKTGGTSINNYLERRFGNITLVDRRRYIDKAGTGFIIPPNHFTVADLDYIAELLPPIDHSFAVVRHPVSRTISQYRYQRAASKLSKLDFSTWLKVAFECARREPRMYENNIRPQSDLVPDGAKAFRSEDGFGPVVEYLDTIAGQSAPEIELPHLNASRKIEVPLSRQDVAAIEDFYAVDYERFGYPLSDAGKLSSDPFSPARSVFAAVAAPIVVARHKQGWTR